METSTKRPESEYMKSFPADRNTQTIIEGNKVDIKKGDIINFHFYKLNVTDDEPVSGDVSVNGELVGWQTFEQIKELCNELFDTTKDLL